MQITACAVSLTVADPEASARFLEQKLDFEREMAADGFVSLTRPDTPIETEQWGERYFQVEDPNGVIIQLVQWVAAPPEGASADSGDRQADVVETSGASVDGLPRFPERLGESAPLQ